MMAGLLMSLRGTPFVYEGQEIGMVNGDFKKLDEVMDIESHNIYAMAKKLWIPKPIRWKMIKRTSRDNARTPMQWSAEENAGFTEGKPWLKVNGNYKEVNVAAEAAKENGILAFWKKMITLRKTNEILMEGHFKALYTGKQVYAFERKKGGKSLIAVCNMTGRVAKLPGRVIRKSGVQKGGSIVVSNYDACDELVLKPFEFRLLEK